MTEIQKDVFVLRDRNVFVYLIRDGEEGLLVDAGYDETARMLLAELDATGVRYLRRVLLTHGHGDHYEGCAELVRHCEVEIGIHPDDARLITETGDYLLYRELGRTYPGMFPLPESHRPAPAATFLLREGSVVPLRGRRLRVLHTPGHSRGSVCLHDESNGLLFSGDTVSGDFVHFYCEPEVADATHGRLAGASFEHLLMAHPYPPAGGNALSGKAAREFLARSAEARRVAMDRVEARMRDRPGVTAQELAKELAGITLISILKMMESLRGRMGREAG